MIARPMDERPLAQNARPSKGPGFRLQALKVKRAGSLSTRAQAKGRLL
jgi:hypothetical protein